MNIVIHGDALRLLEHFVYYSNGPNWQRLAHAMCYDNDGFLIRAHYLKKAFEKAIEDER